MGWGAADCVRCLIDPLRNAEATGRLFAGAAPGTFLLGDHYSACRWLDRLHEHDIALSVSRARARRDLLNCCSDAGDLLNWRKNWLRPFGGASNGSGRLDQCRRQQGARPYRHTERTFGAEVCHPIATAEKLETCPQSHPVQVKLLLGRTLTATVWSQSTHAQAMPASTETCHGAGMRRRSRIRFRAAAICTRPKKTDGQGSFRAEP